MMGAIVLLHRWLGIAFCLLFAMWFSTGIVMHFVPFPTLTEAERFAGLLPVDGTQLISVGDAVTASGIADTSRVRLIQRNDGPVYIVSGPSRVTAVRAWEGANASVASPDIALAIARDHATRRGLDAARAVAVARDGHDQWSVSNGFDRHRPLFRIALGDEEGTELYVSSATGEVVLDTTRGERGWNFAGSVLHWIYPTMLRSNWRLWDHVVWILSLLALIAAALGAILGIVRLKILAGQISTPYRGWHALHHVVGLGTTVFVLTWIFSGWLSMDHGRLFSRGKLTPAEAAVAGALPDWTTVPRDPLSPSAREAEWFAFNDKVYRRDRISLDKQMLVGTGDSNLDRQRSVLGINEIQMFAAQLATGCSAPSIHANNDDYPAQSIVPGFPVYRAICGDLWFDIDGADGSVLQRLDLSRRAYRWVYSALHKLDFPLLMSHPKIRSTLIVGLCVSGWFFSISAVVIGWRRLMSHVSYL